MATQDFTAKQKARVAKITARHESKMRELERFSELSTRTHSLELRIMKLEANQRRLEKLIGDTERPAADKTADDLAGRLAGLEESVNSLKATYGPQLHRLVHDKAGAITGTESTPISVTEATQ